MTRPIFEVWPALEATAPFVDLGQLPTPLSPLSEVAKAAGSPGAMLWEKRDDQTSPVYGGNKVRTLEVLFGDALKQGCTRIYSTGAYGSNHAAASALHAPRVGLEPGIIVYPQPHSRSALENLELILSREPRPPVQDLPHWSALPYGIIKTAVACRRRGVRAYIMEPGGAVPLGALGYVSAGLELATQIAAGVAPVPRIVTLAIGSNCTSAGLLLGLTLAARRSIGFDTPPRLVAVRVTPWPVTSTVRIMRLAVQTSRLLAELSGDDDVTVRAADLRPHFELQTKFIGRGYGFATAGGREAVDVWAAHSGHELETTYSGKAAAAVIDMLRRREPGPIVYWSTKTSAKLPEIDRSALAWAPRRMQRWMTKARSLR